MKNWISSIDQLKEYLEQKQIDPALCHLPTQNFLETFFPMRIPVHYAALIDWQNPEDELRKMVLPIAEEEDIQSYELADPIGDHEKEAVPGLIHRYPDRCLLLLTSHCRVHCRFCFRREVVGKVRPVNFEKIKEYLLAHPEIKEVIFSGGDPGTFPPAFLDNIRRQLSDVKHITRWRFHTRVPAVDPQAISDEWLEAVCKLPGKKVIVIHTNHARELCEHVAELVQKMLDRQILVLSQSVLLKGVNADHGSLKTLFETLVKIGVKPYYLHHLDLAEGTSHFRVSVEEGKKIFRSLRGTLSSVCMPEYVVDLPGGFGKVPIMWLERVDKKTYKALTFEGKEVLYTDYGV